MAGNEDLGKRRGNPDIAKYGFKIQGNRTEALTESIGLRIPKSLKRRFDKLSKAQKLKVRLAGIDAMNLAIDEIEAAIDSSR